MSNVRGGLIARTYLAEELRKLIGDREKRVFDQDDPNVIYNMGSTEGEINAYKAIINMLNQLPDERERRSIAWHHSER